MRKEVTVNSDQIAEALRRAYKPVQEGRLAPELLIVNVVLAFTRALDLEGDEAQAFIDAVHAVGA